MSGRRSDGGPSCCSLLVAIVCLQGAALAAIPRHGGDDDGDASRTYHVSRDDGPTRLKHVADIVDSLAMLGILGNDDDDAKPTCYTVDRIVKSRERADAGRTWRIGIFLYISEQSTAGTDGDAKTRHCVAGATSSVTDDAPRVTTENASSDAAAAAADNVTAAAALNGTDADGQDSEPSQYSGTDNDRFECESVSNPSARQSVADDGWKPNSFVFFFQFFSSKIYLFWKRSAQSTYWDAIVILITYATRLVW